MKQEDKFQDDKEYDYRKGMPKRDKKTKRLKHKYEIFKKKRKENKHVYKSANL